MANIEHTTVTPAVALPPIGPKPKHKVRKAASAAVTTASNPVKAQRVVDNLAAKSKAQAPVAPAIEPGLSLAELYVQYRAGLDELPSLDMVIDAADGDKAKRRAEKAYDDTKERIDDLANRFLQTPVAAWDDVVLKIRCATFEFANNAAGGIDAYTKELSKQVEALIAKKKQEAWEIPEHSVVDLSIEDGCTVSLALHDIQVSTELIDNVASDIRRHSHAPAEANYLETLTSGIYRCLRELRPIILKNEEG